jgi:ubiquinol-cytochrome c reductase cytochrome b subunit
VFGVLALLGGLAQINPIWLYGPYNPAQVSAGSQPDWYIGFLDGALRLAPGWEFRAFGHTVPLMLLIPGLVLPGIMFGLMAAYPFLEARFTKDRARHHLLDRPRDRPVRTSLGVTALTFYTVLLVSGGNDLMAHLFRISLNTSTYVGRAALFVLPPVMYAVSYRICVALQRSDQEVIEHGRETGVVLRMPSGEYAEEHTRVETPQLVLTPVEPERGPAAAGGNGRSRGEWAGAALHRSNGSSNGSGPGLDSGRPERTGMLAAAGRTVGGFFLDRTEDGGANSQTFPACGKQGARTRVAAGGAAIACCPPPGCGSARAAGQSGAVRRHAERTSGRGRRRLAHTPRLVSGSPTGHHI